MFYYVLLLPMRQQDNATGWNKQGKSIFINLRYLENKQQFVTYLTKYKPKADNVSMYQYITEIYCSVINRYRHLLLQYRL